MISSLSCLSRGSTFWAGTSYKLALARGVPSDFERFNFLDYTQLTFEQPDKNTFKCLQLAYDAMQQGGSAPCVLNAANEVAVAAFLQDKIGFLDIPAIIERRLEKADFIEKPTLEELVEVDAEVRGFVSLAVDEKA